MKDCLFKYSLAILVIFNLILFTSCGNDDDPEIASIEGTWNYDEFDIDIRINNKTDIEFFMQEYGLTAAQANVASEALKSEFFEASDFEGTRLIFSGNGSYEIRVNDRIDETGTYVVSPNNSTLSLNSEDEVVVFQILELSRNRLSISLSESFEEDLTEDGVDDEIEILLTLSFVR
ncbi:lipocalin family protein [Belliella sp. DSM 107340]|uniref:Lipocalin family protein n=1 Tax=Belliella calami TaxID=2923436 RepID=A0ABS9UTE1_9BACT|nr:lipocalin family protein [Belliella calami]MCH7399892.1 lipocalin family protein [Belliella calami]